MPSSITSEELAKIVHCHNHINAANLPCFVFDEKEYHIFTQLIHDHWTDIPQQQRWQVILCGGHHCLFDFRKSGSSLEIIAIDSHKVNGYTLAKTTRQLFSQSRKFTLKMIGISTHTQSDTSSCAIFAIEHAHTMATIDLHTLLARELSQQNALANQQRDEENIIEFSLLENERTTPTAFALARPEISARLLKYVQNYHTINAVRKESKYSVLLKQKINQTDTLESYWERVCTSSNSQQTSQVVLSDSKEERSEKTELKLRNNAIDIELQAMRTAVAENELQTNNQAVTNLQDFSRLAPLQHRETFYVNDLIDKGITNAQAVASLSFKQRERLDLLKNPFVYFLVNTKQVAFADFQDDNKFKLLQKLLEMKAYHKFFYSSTLTYPATFTVHQRGKLEYLLNCCTLNLIIGNKLTITEISTLSPAHLWLLSGNVADDYTAKGDDAIGIIKNLSKDDAETLGAIIYQDTKAKTFVSRGLNFFGAGFLDITKLMVSNSRYSDYKRLLPEIILALFLYNSVIQQCQKDPALTKSISINIEIYELQKKIFSCLVQSLSSATTDIVEPLQTLSDEINHSKALLNDNLFMVQTGEITVTTTTPMTSSSSSSMTTPATPSSSSSMATPATSSSSSGGYNPRIFASGSDANTAVSNQGIQPNVSITPTPSNGSILLTLNS